MVEGSDTEGESLETPEEVGNGGNQAAALLSAGHGCPL